MSSSNSAGGAFLRSRVRPVVRRGLVRMGLMDRPDRPQLRPAYRRLFAMYEQLRSRYAAGEVQPSRFPSASDVRTVQAEALRAKMFDTFFHTLCADGDVEGATVSLTRKLIARNRRSRAIAVAQVFERYPDLRPIADICLALCALSHPMPAEAWKRLNRNDLALVLRWAPEEYFHLGFSHDPEIGADSLSKVLKGEVQLAAGPEMWLDIVYYSFSAERFDLARQALQRADAATARIGDRSRRAEAKARATMLQDWLERAYRAREPVAASPDEVSVALVGFQHPDWREVSNDVVDYIDTLSSLGPLLRHAGAEFRGDPDLVSVARRLRAAVPSAELISADAKPVHLYEVDRDVSRYAAIPDGTWIIVSEWSAAPLSGGRYDLPLNPNLRPIFISFHITIRALSHAGVVEYLRKYAPIGCRDWDTVFALHAAGIPAFFSGAIATTVGSVVSPASSRPAAKTLFVDTRPDGPGERQSRFSEDVKGGSLAENLAAAADTLGEYRDGGARVVTGDLRLFLAARAVGCHGVLRPGVPWSYRVADYTTLSDADLQVMQEGLSDKLTAVFSAVLAGRSEAEVYRIWQDVCSADVAKARGELHSISGYPKLNFDLNQVCNTIRSASVTVERSQPAPADGPEVNVEFSLDGNYKHQLDIVLDSVIEHTQRPVRAFVLCRGHGQADFDRMARLFPTVSFVWLPTDDVDYGRIGGMNSWVTPATMDRTIMPALLPEVERIIHFDLDALCLSDLAELFDVDMEGTAIAGATTPQPGFRSGFHTFRRNAERLRREGHPELARELIIRTHSEHEFDFDVFNAGIMLLDLAKMRVDDFCGRVLPYVQRFGLNGQVVLNTYVGRNRKVVGNEWNRLIRLEANDFRKACHWVGQFKPWRVDVYVTGRELWRGQEQRFAARTGQLTAGR